MALQLALDKPPEVEEVVHGARQPQRSRGAVTVHLLRRLEQPPEVGVVEVGYGDGESPEAAAVFALEADPHGQPPLLHLLPLLLILHLLLLHLQSQLAVELCTSKRG